MDATALGYPAVLGEIIAGVLLGPPLLGLLTRSDALAVLGQVGILVMMLYIGMELEPGELKRASKGGILAALGGFIAPFGACYALMVVVGAGHLAGIGDEPHDETLKQVRDVLLGVLGADLLCDGWLRRLA